MTLCEMPVSQVYPTHKSGAEVFKNRKNIASKIH